MKVSIYDVAEKAGVSVVTVSRVLNNAPTVRESSRLKVMAAVEALNYQPSAAARSLAKGKTNVIGIILPNLSDPFLSEVVLQVDLALEQQGYSLAISIIDSMDLTFVDRTNFFMQQERADGILVLTPLFEDEFVQSLQRKGIPFVIMDNQRYPFTVPSVVIDNYKGGYEAAKLLLENGHESIVYIGGPETFLSAEDRLAGFSRALSEVGIAPMGVYRGEFDIDTGYATTCQLLRDGHRPTAIFAGDDHIAFGIVDALREHQLSVPEDVSVIGFDDHPFSGKLHPRLTTIRQPAKEMAEAAVDMLMRILRGELKRNAIVKLEPTLIERESVRNFND